jgi:ornithine--oxo-acid transaminase
MHVDEGKGSFGGSSPKIAHVRDIGDIADGEKAKPTHSNIIRLTPPLVITEEEIKKALSIMKEAMEELPTLKGARQDKVIPAEEKNVHIQVDN